MVIRAHAQAPCSAVHANLQCRSGADQLVSSLEGFLWSLCKQACHGKAGGIGALRSLLAAVRIGLMEEPSLLPPTCHAGTFKLTLEFSEEYPNKAPVVKFVSKLFHPNGRMLHGPVWVDRHCLHAACIHPRRACPPPPPRVAGPACMHAPAHGCVAGLAQLQCSTVVRHNPG